VGFLWLRRLLRPQYYNGLICTGVDDRVDCNLGKTLERRRQKPKECLIVHAPANYERAVYPTIGISR
jgi:hypothetical protein